MAPDGVPCEFRGFQRNLAKPSNQDETAKRRITASSRAIWRLSHGVSRTPMKNGESPVYKTLFCFRRFIKPSFIFNVL
jgi:hypothetical protein